MRRRRLLWALIGGGVLTAGAVILTLWSLGVLGGNSPSKPEGRTSTKLLPELLWGEWEMPYKDTQFTLEFFPDGTYVAQVRGVTGHHGTYRLMDNNLELVGPTKSRRATLDLSGNTMTLREGTLVERYDLVARYVVVRPEPGSKSITQVEKTLRDDQSHREVRQLFLPDPDRLISCARIGPTLVWDLKTGESRRLSDTYFLQVAMSPKGTRLMVFSAKDGSLRLRDLQTDQELGELQDAEGAVAGFGFVDEETIITADDNGGRLRLWSVMTRQSVKTLAGAGPSKLLACASGRRVVAIADTAKPEIVVYDLDSGKVQWTLDAGDGVVSIMFSSDGRTLAAGTLHGTIKLWDTVAGAELGSLRRNNKQVFSLAFSPDGRLLAAGNYDHSIKLFDVAARKEVATIQVHQGSVDSLVFTPDGKKLYARGPNHTIHAVDVSEFAR